MTEQNEYMNHELKRGRNWTDLWKCRLQASLTVEAAAVVSIILIAIASMLLMEFRMHDRLAAKMALGSALEEYSYRNPEKRSMEQISQTANSEQLYILSGHPSVTLTPGLFTYGGSGTVDSGDGQQENIRHIRTETFLRASTVSEMMNLIGKKNETENETEGGNNENSDR